MPIGFTPREVVRLTGLPYSTLNLWAKKGLIVPSISHGSGSGNERIYNLNDLIALKVAFELRKAGVRTQSLQKVVDFVRKNAKEPKSFAHTRLVVSGNDVLEVQSDQQLVSVLRNPGQACLSFVVDLPRTIGKLTSSIDHDVVAVWKPDPSHHLQERKPPVSASYKHVRTQRNR